MVLRWFNTGQARAFGEELARYYDEQARAIAASAAHKREGRYRRLLEQALQRARGFQREQALNMLQKARLSNRLKWTLKDLGYDDELVDRLVREVLLAMT